MDIETGIDFNDYILSTDAFICCSCENLLKCPIVLIKNVGNMCNQCYLCKEDRYDVDAINNKSLEDILKKMYFPCQYEAFGCVQKIKYTDKEKHALSCEFKSIKCMISDSCNWQGIKPKMVDHILDAHKDTILVSENLKFSGQLNLSMNYCTITFVLKASSIYVFTLQKSPVKIFYRLIPVTGELPPKVFLKISSENKENKLKLGFNDLEAEYNQIDVAILSRLFNLHESVKWTIKVEKDLEDVNGKHLSDSILGELECPVCTVYMKPPIYQCSAGHSVCFSCKKRLSRCPTCRGFFGSTRNYSLEGFTSRILYPCMYQDQGCRESALVKDIATHESSCPYKPPTCFLPGCNFTGRPNVPLIKHLPMSHPRIVFIIRNIQNFTMKFDLGKDLGVKKYGIIVNSCVFKFVYKQSAERTFWGVEVVSQSTAQNNNHYIYDLCLIDMKKPVRRLIQTEACLRDVSEADFFKNCISFSNTMVHTFSNNNSIQFYIKIEKSRSTVMRLSPNHD